jgi:two-component system, chemotaxis family, sensor kinase CheA
VGDKHSSKAIKDFLAEAEEIIENLNLDLVKLGDQAESGDLNPDTINGIFRGAHSLKGISGMFGFADIAELSHQMENLLDQLRLGKLPLSTRLIEVLFSALETLTELVNGKSDDEEFTVDLHLVVRSIEQVLSGDATGSNRPLDQLGLDPALLSVLTEYEEHRLLDNVSKKRTLLKILAIFNLSSFDQDLADLTDLLKQKGEVISTLPSPGDAFDKIAFQILFGSKLAVSELSACLDLTDVVVEQIGADAGSVAGMDQTASAPEGFVLEQVVTPAPAPDDAELAVVDDAASLRSISRTVRVDIEKLDNLMNIVGELVLSKGAINRLVDEIKPHIPTNLSTELHKATRVLERRLDDLQAGVMEVRMVPVSQLFEKMTRIVRRVANEHGKKVALDIRGADTELDKLIVEDLTDPLMHIIRNAIDHGIEAPAERLANGKPEKAIICLWASQKGNHVVIEVKDDGHGIDTDQVLNKARAKGLISADTELSKDEIYDLLFIPGFTTRDQVSDLSGRGVGMDVVKNNISALSGMIEIESERGAGTNMIITLPITLAIIKALIVKACGKTYAIPINSVLETLMIDPQSIETIEKREVMELRKSTLPLLRLGEVFELPGVEQSTGQCFAAVVGMAEKRLGIVVDELLGQQDVVIKSLGNALSFVRGIAGAADLGSQKTILVLDVGGLMSEALRGDSVANV